jgi:NADPH:quinone reductase-like Zn-dependent oxidoreductase
MRAILCKEWCEFEALTIDEVPPPELKPESVRIAIKAAGLGFGQSLLVAGKYQRKPELPFVPGVEVAGEVMECAPEITRIPKAPLNLLLVKNVSVMGYSSALYFGWSGEAERKRYAPRIAGGMDRLFNWFEAGLLNPRVQRFDLADFADAMGLIRERRSIGKVVLVP